MKKYILYFLLSLSLASFSACSNQAMEQAKSICSSQFSKITINKTIISAKNACTPEQLMTGLMFIKELPENDGMLFITSVEQNLQFWMKNTYVPLDVAYINNDLVIVDIHTMKPLDLTPIPSKSPASYALEVNAGFFNKNKIKIGDKLAVEK